MGKVTQLKSKQKFPGLRETETNQVFDGFALRSAQENKLTGSKAVMLLILWTAFGAMAILSCVGCKILFTEVVIPLMVSGHLAKMAFGILIGVNPLLWIILSTPFIVLVAGTKEIWED